MGPWTKSMSIQELLGDEEALEIFIGSLASRELGFLVPRSARRFLSVVRMRLGFRPLNEVDEINEIIRGHDRSTPRTVKQAESLEVGDVNRIE